MMIPLRIRKVKGLAHIKPELQNKRGLKDTSKEVSDTETTNYGLNFHLPPKHPSNLSLVVFHCF